MGQSHQRRNAILQMQGEVAVRADAGASPQMEDVGVGVRI